jgi:hypothetical protein
MHVDRAAVAATGAATEQIVTNFTIFMILAKLRELFSVME